jgi:glycosyltransferase involved in cell wall biosynthesis
MSEPPHYARSNGSAPLVTAIVSTRNRAEEIGPCVESILKSENVDFELVVVDQSETDASRRAIEPFASDPRLRLVSTDTRGLSVSRNIGVANSRAEILAFTDDDCRVAPDWLATVASIFAREPDVALLFGRVLRSDGGAAGGFAAEFDPASERVFRDEYPHVLEAWGIGANMALRRSVLENVGGFDPALGAGAPFRAGEDADIAIRFVAAGHAMLHTRLPNVTHLGVRQGEDASQLMRGYGFGLGATLAKHARFGTKGSRRLLGDWILLQGQRSLGNALHGRRPTGLGLVLLSLWGAGRACTKPISPWRSVFSDGAD